MRRRIISVLLALVVTVTMAPAMADTAFAGTGTPYVICKASVYGDRAVKLTWNKTVGATKYVIYANKCGKTCKKIRTVKGNSYTVKKINGNRLRAHNVYKFYVRAYKGTTKLAKSRTLCFITAKTKGKYANAYKITAKYSSKSLLVGSKCKLGATIKIYKGKRHLSAKYGRISFKSSRPDIASVSSYGTVTAKAEGSAKIYIQDISGIYATTTVTVTDPVKILARAKAAAKKAIIEAAGQDASDAVKAIADEYTKDGGIIDQQETVEAVNDKQKEAVEKIAAQKDAETKLAEAKANAKAAITEAAGQDASDAVKAIADEYIKNGGIIDQQKTVEDVYYNQKEAVQKITSQKDAEARLAEAKKLTKEMIIAVCGENLSDEAKAIIEAYTKDGGIIDQQETVEAVENIKYEAIEKVIKEVQLEYAKTIAKKTIEEAAGQDPSDAVKAIVSEYAEDDGVIDQQETLDGVIAKQQEAVDKIKAQQAAELENAKTAAKKAINEAAGQDPSDIVKAIASEYTKDGGIIDQQETINAVNDKQKEAVDKIAAQKEAEAKLAEAKAKAKAAITEAAGQDASEAVKAIADEYTKDGGIIDQQETVEDVEYIQKEAVQKIASQKDAEARLAEAKKLTKEMIIAVCGENLPDEAKAIIEAYTKDGGIIDQQETVEAVENVKYEAIEKVIKEVQLKHAKTIAKKTIEEAAGQNPSDAVKAIVSEYAKDGGVIDQQKTVKAVNDKQQEAVEKIKKQQDADLEKTKAAAKEAIENQLKKHDGGNTRMLYLADKAKGEIDKAKTIDEVNKLKEDCIKAIEEAVPSEGFEVFYSFDKQFMIVDKEMQWDAAMAFAKSKGGHVASVAELNRLRNADMATLKPDEYYWDMKIYKRLKNNVLWTCQESHGFWAEGDSVAYIYNSGGTNNHSRSIEESVIIIKD